MNNMKLKYRWKLRENSLHSLLGVTSSEYTITGSQNVLKVRFTLAMRTKPLQMLETHHSWWGNRLIERAARMVHDEGEVYQQDIIFLFSIYLGYIILLGLDDMGHIILFSFFGIFFSLIARQCLSNFIPPKYIELLLGISESGGR